MSKTSSKPKTESKSFSADDILADLMNDLKEVDKTVVGFDPTGVSEDGIVSDPTSMTDQGAPDNLDLDHLDDGVRSDALMPGMGDQKEEQHVTIMTNVSVSMNASDETEIAPTKEASSIFGDQELGDLNLDIGGLAKQLKQTKVEKNPQVIPQEPPEFKIENEEKTSIFAFEDNKEATNNLVSEDLPTFPQEVTSVSAVNLAIPEDVQDHYSLSIDEQKNNDSLFDLKEFSHDDQSAHFDLKTEAVSNDTDQRTILATSNLAIQNPVEDVFSDHNQEEGERTVAISHRPEPKSESVSSADSERTVAVAGFNQQRSEDESLQGKVKISVGQVRGNAFSSGYAAWGSADSNLVQAENLRIAQEKILELEKENEKLRNQNEDLISASEIVKERADLLNAQLHEYKNDQDSLEQSFKNELAVVKKQLERKDTELAKATAKAEELESKIKFDLKKIRIRERELENRLELIRAEKNALVKSKDEQILDLKRKLDQVQLEVESYRQKCVDLNKVIETNQDSFKRTTRALRLAMANLELQEENKAPLKKVD